ncbi:MAG: LTA synthase family protein [Clostridia bacterium]|nr:LTA synthase family protein [Clostridia bacterium]
MYSFFILTIALSEYVFLFSSTGTIKGAGLMWPFWFIAAFTIAVICDLFKGKAKNIAEIVVTVVLFVYYSVQLVYQHIFKSYLSIAQIGMGADAISTYKKETLIGIGESLPYILLLAVPLILLILLNVFFRKDSKHTRRTRKMDPRKRMQWIILEIFIIAAFHALMPGCLTMFGTNSYSPYDTYTNTFVLAQSQKYFGCLTSTRLEIRNMLFGKGTGSIVDEGKEEEPEVLTPAAIEYPYNIKDIDFAALAASNKDEKTKVLDEYFANKKATRQNEYTGMFKDYNVIQIVCESFSPYLIDEQRTPTLWKMAHDGFVFNNYYSTINDNTSNSEYTFLNSLLPDTSLLGKGWQTFYDYNSCTASKDNYMPHTLNNLFKAGGLKSVGFHYYYGTYYGRKDTHPNFGMDFYYMTKGLKKTEDWPTSDLQMMQQTMQYYLKPNAEGKIDRFCAYYLTFSGHMQYRFDTNNVAKRNKEVSDGLPYQEAVRAYVSCNEELEYAVKYLIEELDKAGVLDNTLIVLTPDHYPYTLGLDKLSELAGKDLLATDFDKEFNQYKGCLLMWSNSMKEPVVVDSMMCELDILPTVLNLLGAEFDSRLLMGTDIFSDSEHIAILGDRSFISDKIYFNAATGEITKKTDENVDDAYVNRISNMVKNKFTISTEILYTDYYRHAYGVN